MYFNDKKLFLKTFGWFSLFNIIAYALMHLSFNLSPDVSISTDVIVTIELARVYLTRLWEFVFPVVGGALMLLECRYNGVKRALIGGAVIGSARMFYCTFSCYLDLIIIGLDTSEAIPYSLLISLVITIATFMYMSLLCWIGSAFLKNKLKKDRWSANKSLSKIGAPIIPLIISQFIIFLAVEIVDTVQFFIEFGLDYRTGEIFTIVFNYLFLIIISLFSYFLTSHLIRKTEYRRLSED